MERKKERKRGAIAVRYPRLKHKGKHRFSLKNVPRNEIIRRFD